ncbi:MAG: DUF1318 domain-containing protein [Kiritimatiellae bacterium]|nr:DUF1318 domain-containing protein [Kiritimatiellia bacterium]
MKTITMRLFTIMVCMAALTLTVLADAKTEAHERRKARKDEVAALITSGEAEEGENGFLEPKKAMSKEKQALLKDENADRKIGYEAIAKEHKTSVEAISKAAGKINRKRSAEQK